MRYAIYQAMSVGPSSFMAVRFDALTSATGAALIAVALALSTIATDLVLDHLTSAPVVTNVTEVDLGRATQRGPAEASISSRQDVDATQPTGLLAARIASRLNDQPGDFVVGPIGVAHDADMGPRPYSGEIHIAPGSGSAMAIAEMRERYETVREMFRGFDYQAGLGGSAQVRFGVLAGAVAWILDLQRRDAARETTVEGKRLARRRFSDAVLALSEAFSLAASSFEARRIENEVEFFQIIRAVIAKSDPDPYQT